MRPNLMRFVTFAALSLIVAPIAGCVRGHGNARGAATIEELVAKYEAAHRERSIEKLRDIVWWEAPEAGSGHLKDYEQLMSKLFAVELEHVEYVQGPAPDPVYGGIASWVRSTPAGRRQVASVAGPVYGKLLLVGSVGREPKRSMTVDPAYVVMQSLDRYYIDIQSFVLEDAVTSIRTGEPSQSEPLPLGADPSKVPRNW